MARENRSERCAMSALAFLLAVLSLTVVAAIPAGAYFYDSDGDGLPDLYEIKHGILVPEGRDSDGDLLEDDVEDANRNGIVDVGETDPANWDTDGDGISDGIEGLLDSPLDEDALIDALDLDSDGDFIPDGVEDADQDGEQDPGETGRLDPDSDDDGLIDGWESMWGTDPLIPNGDGDGWNDFEEVILYGSDPNDPDTDGDGRVDGVGNEDGNDSDGDGAINAVDFDSDNDGLTDAQEDTNGNGEVDESPLEGETDPTLYDSDGDGFSDGYEWYEADSDPLSGIDTDGDGWYDGEEIAVYKTDPDNVDTDGDGRWDSHGNEDGRDSDGDGLINALDLDSDNDGLHDEDEDADGDAVVGAGETDPTDVDTDADGIWDNHELNIYGTSPIDINDPLDADGLLPGDELYLYGTGFDMDDTDGDGVVEGNTGGTDAVNANFDGNRPRPFGDSSVNALDVDADGDGLWDGDEASYGTGMVDWDTDGDGLLDGEEVHIWDTDPTMTDTDGDGLQDDDEIATGTNPLDVNTDGDFVEDGVEVNGWGSDPLDPDTDGDGIMDGETITGHYIDASGVSVEWTYVENNSDNELGGDGLPNWRDVDADWLEQEQPAAGGEYQTLHDRTELAYAAYVTASGLPFEVGPLNPGALDTDGDGFSDADEVANGFDPLDARDYGEGSEVTADSDSDGLFDVEEFVLEGAETPTMHLGPDHDGDGLWDGDELHPNWFALDGFAQTWSTDPTDADVDDDGLHDAEELVAGTNPHYGDSDRDGVPDGDDNNWYDALIADVDGDGLYDGYEDADRDGVVDAGETSAEDGDSDEDGISDGDELTFGTDPLDPDTDGDNLWDGLEVGYDIGNIVTVGPGPWNHPWTDAGTFGAGDQDTGTKTDPRLADSDFDGWDDGAEDLNWNGLADVGELDAADRDTDGDALPDYYEPHGNSPTAPYSVGWVDNSAATDFLAADSEADGLHDDDEFAQESDPWDPDTDGDTLLDGDEIAYGTDPTNADTDGDGCPEGTVECALPGCDSDNDGAVDAMDVDSDNDWYRDCDGDENYSDDVDSDGLVNVFDNDTDNDNLSDRIEMGLDTWHEPADNDRDFDDDCILDGDEYYQVVHQPHTGETGFEASDPKLFDTDGDGLYDGFERGATDTIPVVYPYGGTMPSPGYFDADGVDNSHPSLYDTDMDGLSDYDEDIDMDGDNADIGVGNTEPGPRDDDTDDDGLIDGYETIDGAPTRGPGTNCIMIDTDGDQLLDGLEWGLLRAMGRDTHPVPPWPFHARYDLVEDGAYTTDPTNPDTDGDGLYDGTNDLGEDLNWNGYRNGNSPFDANSDWGGFGETDPNVCDTDRGGVDDAAEILAGSDPLLFTDGDWDIDLTLGGGGRASGDTLDVGVADVGIAPGGSGVSTVTVVHTDAGLNPDLSDGPSSSAWPLEDVYLAATSLHWAGEHPGAGFDPMPDDEDWIHYSAVSFDPPEIDGFVRGTSVDVEVTVNVPEGALPGWYTGHVQVQTARENNSWPDDCVHEQELPDDYIVLRVWVGPRKDLDICDNDGDQLGVGLASDPYDFWEDAEHGEMHLAGAPYHPNGIRGTFRLANPNTNPDGVFPVWQPEPPDRWNDLNGLPAVPWLHRDWDMDLPDQQGNVDLMHDIEAQFEFVVGEVDCTPYVSFDSPLSAGLALATVDSFHVYIDTSGLPQGSYEGWVRVFEDIPHGVDPPNGTWDVDEVFDTFYLELMLVLPDLDIDDEYANMSGNELTIDVEPGDVGVMIGDFQVYATGPATNLDDWDGPGTESIFDLAYYDPTTDTLEKIPADGSGSVSVFPELPDGSHSIEVLLSGWMGDTLILNGPSKLYRLTVADVPLDLPSGAYRMDHPETWVPGDGTVPIAARGLDTGMGWLDGEAGPAVVYDPAVDGVAPLMDFFHLTINVAAVVDVEFAELTLLLDDADPGTMPCGTAAVNNVGNTVADDVHFQAGNLIGRSHGEVLSSDAVGFDPASVAIELDGSATVEICVAVPAGTRADTLVGTVFLLADGEQQFDEIGIAVDVNCLPGMYATAALEALVLDEGAGATPFTITNTGNCDLTGVNGDVDIAGGLVCSVAIESPIDWQAEVAGLVNVEAGSSRAGTYHGTVTLRADGGAEDSFPITVVVPERRDIAFASQADVVLEGEAGATLEGSVAVRNTGNVTITSGVDFAIEDLLSYVQGDPELNGSGAVIPYEVIEFDSQVAALDVGEELDFGFTVDVPGGLLGQRYENTLNLTLDGSHKGELQFAVDLPRGESYVRIYPNPVKTSETNEVTIALGDRSSPDLKVLVYDMFGGLVTELTAEGSSDVDVRWDLKNDDGRTVASGMYVVTIDTGDEVVTRKIMVIK